MNSQPAQHHAFETCSFYVVQKCWYSGPNVTPTVDYLRLLPSLAEAEQVAYQSAHAYSGGVLPVRTLQLPIQQNAASSYGFVSKGILFWIRCIDAYSTPGVVVSPVVDSAHCITTQGVIGGTGNRNSARGNENITTPRVFVGSASYAWALTQSTSGLVPAGSTCQWVPVGKPNFENITAEWPDRNTWHSAIEQRQPTVQSNTKRESDSASEGHWFISSNYKNNKMEQHDSINQSTMEVENTESSNLYVPPAKRRCPPSNAFQPGSPGGFQFGVSMKSMDVFMGS